MSSFVDLLSQYDYKVPPELIATVPASPRDSARLLILERSTGTTAWATFREINQYLPPKSLLVLNQTKVIPAKLNLKRETGGMVSILSLGTRGDHLKVFANRKLKKGEWLEIVPDRKEPSLGGDMTCHVSTESVGCTVIKSQEKEWLLQPSFPLSDLPEILIQFGDMPLPPYIKHTPLTRTQQRMEYQSVFAKDDGSIAAPTASLHFTKELLTEIEAAGHHIAYVTLHVHLGTFAPLTEEQWKSGALHLETYHIDEEAKGKIENAKSNHHPVIAVGTTVVRTLESAADPDGQIVRMSGETDLFIQEGHRFKVVDGLITNFHVPRSSLLMLISTFAGRETILDLYGQAMEKKFRFFSFGDGMLIV